MGFREQDDPEFAPLMQRNKSIMKLLIWYGTTKDGVFLNDHQPAAALFKQIFNDSQQLAEEKRKQEALLKEGSLQVKYTACQRLSQLWRQLSAAEPPEHYQIFSPTQRLHDVLRMHYAEKAKLYADQVQQLAVELKKPSTEKKVAVSHEGSQPYAHDHPAHLYLSSSRAARAENVPLLQNVAQTAVPAVELLSKKLN